ncbi:MAG: hypothetical protein ACRD3M_15710 [Thermoanaerobaculia bacterium]
MSLSEGDYLVFLMGGNSPVPGDLEMQVVLGYSPGPRVVSR